MWLSRSGVGRAVPGRRGGVALAGAIYGAERGCFPSAGAVSGNMHATAQPVLDFSWGTSAAHRSSRCVVSPPGTAGVRGAVGKPRGSLEPAAGLQLLLSHGCVSRALGWLLPGSVVAQGCQPCGAGAGRAGHSGA